MRIIIFLLLLFPKVMIAQFIDYFDDGDFSNNPEWTGDTAFWNITNGQLRSNGPAITNTSLYLSTISTISSNCEWEFFANPKLATSSGNYMDVFLMSDQENLNSTLNGYFVRIGGTPDEVSLFVKQGNNVIKIIDGVDGLVSSASNNPFKIRIKRDFSFMWTLETDAGGTGNNYTLQGNIIDSTFNVSSYFGVFIKYSSANNQKFYFDDFRISPILIDTISPSVTAITIISSNQITITFSELVDKTSAENASNYLVNNGHGSPTTAIKDLNDASTVHLTFQNSFQSGITNTISINGITDLSGNSIDSTIRTFLFYKPSAFDVVFNEIMADPTPSIGLPEYEFIEIFNKSIFPLNLLGWTLKYGNTSKVFPEVIIKPDSFLIICTDAAMAEFKNHGKVISIPGLSSTALTNGGTTLQLIDNTGTIIHFLLYSDTWYKNDSKTNGGWSLEQIDPNNPCGGTNNWTASNSFKGGTPGKKNSVDTKNGDNAKPEIERAFMLDSLTLRVFFTESMKEEHIKDVNRFFIDNNMGTPKAIIPLAPNLKSVLIILPSPLLPEKIYTLTINDSLTDCVGNILAINSSVKFALTEAIKENDIIINEVLFNPKDDGVDFVELYNKSLKVIDLKFLRLSNKDSFSGTLLTPKLIDTVGFVLFPGDYVVLSTSTEKIKRQYYTSNSKNFIQMASFPSFNNTEGNVVISTINEEIIDSFSYNEEMHFKLLNSFEGVSLERINPEMKSSEAKNWHSASENVGFATPAYQNSQFMKMSDNTDEITIHPKLFSPDNDGNNDFVSIQYKLNKPGCMGNIRIYNSNGKLIKQLAKNELLGSTGMYIWDGIDEIHEKSPFGIYIIYLEIFDLKGYLKKYKYTCVLIGGI